MNKDYSYCSGVTCPIRNECKRYLPDPPDVPLWWIPPAYKESICNRLLLNILQVISQKYGLNL